MERHLADPFGCRRTILQSADVTGLDRKYIRDVFQASDRGQKGCLDSQDMAMAFISLFGYTPDEGDVEKLMQERETVCFEEFFEAVAVRYASRDEQEDTRQAFLAMDSSCRGFLTLVDLRKAMKIVAPWLEKRADEIFRELDTDGDGRVSYREFETMMQTMGMG